MLPARQAYVDQCGGRDVALETVQVDDYVRVDWLYETSEYIDKQAFNMSKFVKLGHAGMEWAPDQ